MDESMVKDLSSFLLKWNAWMEGAEVERVEQLYQKMEAAGHGSELPDFIQTMAEGL